MENLLKLREKKRKKNPKFIRQDAHKKKRLEKKWRRPKGLQSKMRLKLKGYRKIVKPGYKKPRKTYKLHKSGLKAVNVNNVYYLDKVDQKAEGIVINKIGMKNRIEIIKKCLEKKIRILNIKDPELFLKNVEEQLKKKVEEKKKIAKEKEEKKKEKEKKAKEKEGKKEKKKGEKEDDELTKKLEKEEEKKEKDKVLTKKEIK